MKSFKIVSTLLMLSVFLITPSNSFSQNAAEKSWPSFWARFSDAAKSKSKPAMKQLMSSEREFFSGGGGETRDEWLRLLDRNKAWRFVQASVGGGIVQFNEDGRIGKITKDRNLIFQFIRGRWRFVGVMGD